MTELHFFDPNPSGLPVVLLLHGLGVNASSWSLQFDPLIKAGFRPLAPDLPGFGESRYDGRGWTVKRVVAALADLLAGLGSGPIYLVGISLGGMVAQQFVFDHPHLVKKLILVSSFAALRPEHSTGWFYLLRRVLLVVFKGIPEQAAFVAARLFPQPEQEALRRLFVEQIVQADPRAYRAAMLAIALFDSRRRLARVRIPTLVVSGANDGTASPFMQKTLAQGIPNARQIIIAGAGHAVSVDHPEEFNQAMMEFLLAL